MRTLQVFFEKSKAFWLHEPLRNGQGATSNAYPDMLVLDP